ncbi:MAG: ATP-dependent DNA ligase [Thermoplasmata archaeon]|nr:ATP-dependent DNA ligase [Thermoplasmata archaeon]
MRYARLVDTYESLEATTKRLEMTDHLVDLFKETPPDILDKVVYLTQGKLYPDFMGVELGVGEKVAVRAIANASGHPESEIVRLWKETGDLGTTGERVLERKRQQSLFTQPLTVEAVHSGLDTLARASGRDSLDAKIKILSRLLHDATPREARYILRTVDGKLRLGIADMTILDALSLAFASKEDRPTIEAAYNRCSDLGMVAVYLAHGGLEAVRDIHLKLGVPLRAMLAERVQSMEEIFEKMGGPCLLEYKYDGLRLQAHVFGDGRVRLYSRHLEDLTDQFPDVVKSLRRSIKGHEAIVEGECVPVGPDGEMRPFQEISHRRGRKYNLQKAMEEVPVVFFAFDILYLDGEELMDRPLPVRRKRLESLIREGGGEGVRLSTALETGDIKKAEEFFQESIAAGCEGIMAKSIGEDSVYRAGARGWQWIKYKRDYKAEMSDTVDLVAVGAFAGRGRRGGAYGALLMAAYNPEEDVFETVCKLGTGFDDETLFSLRERFTEHPTIHPRVKSEMEADYWLVPEVVMEVAGAEITLSPIHTCARDVIRKGSGLAIRFPRFTGRWRDDKSPEEATTTKELVEMYRQQLKKVG